MREVRRGQHSSFVARRWSNNREPLLPVVVRVVPRKQPLTLEKLRGRCALMRVATRSFAAEGAQERGVGTVQVDADVFGIDNHDILPKAEWFLKKNIS